MAEETATGSITLADPNNGPLVRWAATAIEEFTSGTPEAAGFTVLPSTTADGRRLTLTIERNEEFDAKDDDNGS